MLDFKLDTLLAVAEKQSYTKASEALSLTQPAVSHQIRLLEDELGAKLFTRNGGKFVPTKEGEIAVRYAYRLKGLDSSMKEEIRTCGNTLSRLRVGITHTTESNAIAEALAKYGSRHRETTLTMIADTTEKLYEMMGNYELDLLVVEEKRRDGHLRYLMLDTDYLACIISPNSPLGEKEFVKIKELRKEQLLLRLPSSSTRRLFEASLRSLGESIDGFNIALEVDNIATIKDLIRKDIGVSVLPVSACLDEIRKGKLKALPIENLSMLREIDIVAAKDFPHPEILEEIVALYKGEDV